MQFKYAINKLIFLFALQQQPQDELNDVASGVLLYDLTLE